jgi:predicted RecA/RadA family phage recombinase
MKRIGLILAVALCMALPSFAARYRVSDAGIMQYTNPGAKILSGQIVDLTYRYGIAAGDIASNATKSVFLDGVWLLARADTNAIALGANVYFNSISNVTGTAGVGQYIGQCVEAVEVCTSLTDSLGRVNKFVKVDIGAPQKQIVVGVDTQPHDADLDILAAGLTDASVWIGDSADAPAIKALSGLFTIDRDGVATATTTGPAVTNVATQSEIDCLDSITPATAAALTGLGPPTTASAITGFGPHTTANAVTDYAAPTTTDAVYGVTVTLQTAVGYDSTGAAITNAAGIEIAMVTGVVVDVSATAVLTALGTPTTAAAITALGTPTTAAAVTGYASTTTANFIQTITSNVVQALKTVYFETGTFAKP